MGYHQPLTLTDEGGREVIKVILDRLIDEELIQQAAETEGLTVDPAELEANLATYRNSFGCQTDPSRSVCQATLGSAGESLVKAVSNRLILNDMMDLVARKDARYNSADWRHFFRNWLAKYSFSSVYRVRVLLTQDTSEARRILSGPGALPASALSSGSLSASVNLETLAERLRKVGLETKVAGPLSLNLMAPETLKRFREVDLGRKLTLAAGRSRKLTEPLSLTGSLAVFEVLEIIQAVDPEKLAQAAINEYERSVREKAFSIWLAKIRSEAVIELNPNIQYNASEGGLADILRPKVPWNEQTPWDDSSQGPHAPPGTPEGNPDQPNQDSGSSPNQPPNQPPYQPPSQEARGADIDQSSGPWPGSPEPSGSSRIEGILDPLPQQLEFPEATD
jgi:hypothetical protein